MSGLTFQVKRRLDDGSITLGEATLERYELERWYNERDAEVREAEARVAAEYEQLQAILRSLVAETPYPSEVLIGLCCECGVEVGEETDD